MELHGAGHVCLRVLKEEPSVITRLLSVLCKRSWQLGEIPDHGKKANTTPLCKKVERRMVQVNQAQEKKKQSAHDPPVKRKREKDVVGLFSYTALTSN